MASLGLFLILPWVLGVQLPEADLNPSIIGTLSLCLVVALCLDVFVKGGVESPLEAMVVEVVKGASR